MKGGTTFLYRYILKEAWLVTKKNKYLWFFGFFVAFWGGGAILTLMIKLGQAVILLGEEARGDGVFLPSFFLSTIFEGGYAPPQTIIFISLTALVLFLLCAVFLWFVFASYGALIFAAGRALKGKTARFKDSLKVGADKFASSFAILVGGKALSTAFILLSLSPILFSRESETVLAAITSSGVFVLSIAAAFIVSILTVLSLVEATMEKISLAKSLKAACVLFARHWIIFVELAFLLLVLELAVGTIALFISAMLLAPAVLFFFLILSVGGGAITAGAVGGIYLLFAYLLLFVFLTSWLMTFEMVSWTALCLRLREKGGLAKIVRLLTKATRILKRAH